MLRMLSGKRFNRSAYVPLRTKFIILFCLLITIPFLVIGTISYKKYIAGVERNTVELSNQVVSQININLEHYIKELDRLTLAPLYDEDMMQILRKHRLPGSGGTYLSTDETLKMNLFISSLAFDRGEIESILVFTNDGGIFSNLDQSVRKRWDRSMAEWMETVEQADGGLAILPPHSAAYYTEAKQGIISVARVIREPYTHAMLGIVKVDLMPRGFGSIVSTVRSSGSGLLQITGKDQVVLYSGAGKLPDSRESYITASAESPYTGLKVTSLMPRAQLREDARELTNSTLIVSIVALMAAYVAAILLSSRLIKPIAHLQSKMRQVKRGLFLERATVTTSDEIGQLTEGFNTMIGEIDRLVKEVYETRLKEREAELLALQSQIHPHFLYNTLEMVNMLALQGNTRELSGVVTSLGKLLRYTVGHREQMVYVLDEVKFVEAYLRIQGMRLGDKLEAVIHIDSSFDSCVVPKLILQPLIENVIEHAMGPDKLCLTLTASVEEEDLILSVRDNGLGITRARMLELEEQLYSRQPRAAADAEQGGFGRILKGFALRNVHQRLRLLYGEPYGLTLDNTAEQGVTVSLRLPMNWEAMNDAGPAGDRQGGEE
ncbi:sensor histidine kinase [Paenibacillus silagei]|uniref:Two-component system sensor histidine kinase YesM n=1 Tax=Paenibacillus silagei TaxID=1670801 RepID=A0ABS4NRN2_9BACL|nr:histidine kinase [Paenibacillus silagei]MBP2112074.1 two-component system sensor histidine kinase YesM [Paenibacillus silagei]